MVTQNITKISSKGQLVVPKRFREYLHLQENDFVAIKITKQGLLLCPVEIKEKDIYSEEELDKIEKLAADKLKKGKVFNSSSEAMEYLKSL